MPDENNGEVMGKETTPGDVDLVCDEPKLILSELLCYMQYHIKRTVNNNIVEVVARHFSMEEVSKAKDILLDGYGNVIAHHLKIRRNTNNKNKCISMCEDIMQALKELDMKGMETHFVAMNLSRLPRCDPKDIDPYATMQMMLAIDDRLKIVEDSVVEAKAQLLLQNDSLKSVKESVKTHELLLTTSILPKSPTYRDKLLSNRRDTSGATGPIYIPDAKMSDSSDSENEPDDSANTKGKC